MTHTWQDCYPILWAGEPHHARLAGGVGDELIHAVFDTVITTKERLRFHEFTCLGLRTDEHISTVYHIYQMLKSVETTGAWLAPRRDSAEAAPTPGRTARSSTSTTTPNPAQRPGPAR